MKSLGSAQAGALAQGMPGCAVGQGRSGEADPSHRERGWSSFPKAAPAGMIKSAFPLAVTGRIFHY